MSTLQQQIEAAFKPLMGCPLTGVSRAGATAMLSFGATIKTSYKGKLINISEYSLHLQCAWRITSDEGIFVGCEDLSYPHDETADWLNFHPDKSTSILDAKVGAWMKALKENPLMVTDVQADRFGGFRLLFSEGYALETFPANSLTGEYSEHWRLFRTSEDDEPGEGRHFVVTGDDIGS